MTHTVGQRRHTRKLFRKGFRQTGAIRMKNYLTTYKVGDHVDVVVDGSQHKVPWLIFLILGHALQILPWKNRKGFQRQSQSYRCHHEQIGRKQDYCQENSR